MSRTNLFQFKRGLSAPRKNAAKNLDARKNAAQAAPADRTPSAAGTSSRMLQSPSPQTTLGHPAQARTATEVQAAPEAEVMGRIRRVDHPVTEKPSFFGGPAVPSNPAGEPGTRRVRRVSFGASQEKEFDAGYEADTYGLLNSTHEVQHSPNTATSHEQHDALYDPTHEQEHPAYRKAVSPAQEIGFDEKHDSTEEPSDEDATPDLVEEATAQLKELHDARDTMHAQLDHIESTLSITDIEKPDTALANLGMDANDDLADVLKMYMGVKGVDFTSGVTSPLTPDKTAADVTVKKRTRPVLHKTSLATE